MVDKMSHSHIYQTIYSRHEESTSHIIQLCCTFVNTLKGRVVNWLLKSLSPERQSAQMSEIKNVG